MSIGLDRLAAVLASMPQRVVACSGGIDSLLLATVAHRQRPEGTWIAHAISAAVPAEATQRVRDSGSSEHWRVEMVRSGEFDDEDYLRNPTNRCYFCKRSLYGTLHRLASVAQTENVATVLSGANLDDLGEYRPGLTAASEHGVRHPFIEAGFSKKDIRAAARWLGLSYAELPASPCLSSRLYTGTRVTAERLRAIETGEHLIRQQTGVSVVRCRLREDRVLIEVGDADRRKITANVVAEVARAMRTFEPGIASVALDAESYRPGRAFVIATP